MSRTLLEMHLATLGDTLTKNDRKVCDYLTHNPDKFTKLSISELAGEIDISVAAITRFAKRLGYEKLTDFKLALSKEMGSSSSTVKMQFRDVDRDDDIDAIAQKVIARNVNALHEVQSLLDRDCLLQAVNLITRAQRIIFTGLGGSASVAQDAFHKFRRLGITCELVDDANSQMIVSSVGNDGDLIIAISNEGANAQLNQALKVAKSNGMKLLAITRFANSPLGRLADTKLITPMNDYGERAEPLISRLASYCLVDIVYVAYCMSADGTLDDTLLQVTNNMKLLKKYDN